MKTGNTRCPCTRHAGVHPLFGRRVQSRKLHFHATAAQSAFDAALSYATQNRIRVTLFVTPVTEQSQDAPDPVVSDLSKLKACLDLGVNGQLLFLPDERCRPPVRRQHPEWR
jgi:hypothetical protein